MKVEITITANEIVGQAEPHIVIECRPNEECLPAGAFRDRVVQMLEAGTCGMTKTLDVRGPGFLKLATEEPQ